MKGGLVYRWPSNINYMLELLNSEFSANKIGCIVVHFYFLSDFFLIINNTLQVKVLSFGF